MNGQPHYNIFYSWQSDIPKNANHYFINAYIEKAIKELKRESDVSIVPRLDKSLEGKTGSPAIAKTIFEKIDQCQIFIADVTIINKFSRKRLTPNPNVLLELGPSL